MSQLFQILGRLRSRSGLIGIAAILLCLNGGRLLNDKYLENIHAIESKEELFAQYRRATRDIEQVRKQVKRLQERQLQFDSLMFTGASREEVTSAMQIKLQEIMVHAGLSQESLRPVRDWDKGGDEGYGEVVIKIRLTGTLERFVEFLAELYGMKYFFKIENFTLKPFKKTELKVFLEVKGFYHIKGIS